MDENKRIMLFKRFIKSEGELYPWIKRYFKSTYGHLHSDVRLDEWLCKALSHSIQLYRYEADTIDTPSTLYLIDKLFLLDGLKHIDEILQKAIDFDIENGILK